MRDRTSAAALIAGAVASMIVMLLHPTGHQLLTAAGRSVTPFRVGVLIHVLAIAAYPVLFFGGIGISRVQLNQRGLATGALVAFGVAGVAVVSAALMSGMVATDLIQRLAGADPTQRDLLHTLLWYTGRLNQGYAKVFVTAESLAIILWSVAMLKNREFHRAIGVYGCVVGAAALVGVLSGRLVLNVHGEGLVIFAQAVWLIAVGIQLGWRRSP